MDKLNELCFELENNLVEAAESLEFNEVISVFQLRDFKSISAELLPSSPIFNSLNNVSGLYLFEIKKDINTFKEWFDTFENKFHNLNEKKDFFRYKFTPRVNKLKKDLEIYENQDWIPLYVGKSQNLKQRMHEHLFSKLGKSPFGLKLYSRFEHDVFLDNFFRLKIIRLDRIDKKNYAFIAPNLEIKLKRKIRPIVGK